MAAGLRWVSDWLGLGKAGAKARFFLAIKNGNAGVVRRLLGKRPEFVNEEADGEGVSRHFDNVPLWPRLKCPLF
jgi:hypothetical protein